MRAELAKPKVFIPVHLIFESQVELDQFCAAIEAVYGQLLDGERKQILIDAVNLLDSI